MPKYYDKTQLPFKEQFGEAYDMTTYTAIEVKKNTTITNDQGMEVLVTPPNLILTDDKGKKSGITPQDLEARFVEV